MSLIFLYNKLEKMNIREQYCYIENIFQQLHIDPIYPIEENFKDTRGKQVKNKNPLGYLVMHLDKEQLNQLIPQYYRQLLFNENTFSNHDYYLMNVVDCIKRAIDNVQPNDVFQGGIEHKQDCMLRVFEFGVGKYHPWSFLELNPYTLIPAVFRHLYKSENISKIDEESGELHTAHAACNIYMIKHILKRIEGEANAA